MESIVAPVSNLAEPQHTEIGGYWGRESASYFWGQASCWGMFVAVAQDQCAPVPPVSRSHCKLQCLADSVWETLHAIAAVLGEIEYILGVLLNTTRLWFFGPVNPPLFGAKHFSLVLDPPACSRQRLGVSISTPGAV